MSLNLENKKTVVAEVVEVLKSAQTVVIASYQGVTVDKMTAIRSEARSSGVYLRVLKNTLARIAVSDTGFAPLADKMSGQLIYAVSEDAVSAAKIMHEFAKNNDTARIVGGIFNNQLLDEAGVKHLASIPSREELLAKVMGVIREVPASFVRTVAAIRDQKSAESVA